MLQRVVLSALLATAMAVAAVADGGAMARLGAGQARLRHSAHRALVAAERQARRRAGASEGRSLTAQRRGGGGEGDAKEDGARAPEDTQRSCWSDADCALYPRCQEAKPACRCQPWGSCLLLRLHGERCAEDAQCAGRMVCADAGTDRSCACGEGSRYSRALDSCIAMPDFMTDPPRFADLPDLDRGDEELPSIPATYVGPYLVGFISLGLVVGCLTMALWCRFADLAEAGCRCRAHRCAPDVCTKREIDSDSVPLDLFYVPPPKMYRTSDGGGGVGGGSIGGGGGGGGGGGCGGCGGSGGSGGGVGGASDGTTSGQRADAQLSQEPHVPPSVLPRCPVDQPRCSVAPESALPPPPPPLPPPHYRATVDTKPLRPPEGGTWPSRRQVDPSASEDSGSGWTARPSADTAEPARLTGEQWAALATLLTAAERRSLEGLLRAPLLPRPRLAPLPVPPLAPSLAPPLAPPTLRYPRPNTLPTPNRAYSRPRPARYHTPF